MGLEGYVMEAIKELKEDVKEIKTTTKNIEISMVRSQDKLDLHDKTLSAHSEEINCIKKDMSKNNFWASFFGQNSWVQKFAKFIIIVALIIFLVKAGYDASNLLSVLITG
jgi:hypothetical protein